MSKPNPTHTRLKPKSIKVLDEILNDPKISKTEAYMKHHPSISRRNARTEAAKLTAKPSAQIYLKEHIQMAKNTIVSIVGDETVKPDTRLKAADSILDRELGKPIQRSEVKTENLNLNVQASQELSDSFSEWLRQQTREE